MISECCSGNELYEENMWIIKVGSDYKYNNLCFYIFLILVILLL